MLISFLPCAVETSILSDGRTSPASRITWLLTTIRYFHALKLLSIDYKMLPQMNAEELIIRKIRKEGPIPFRDFMELALYAQDFGYYMSLGHKTGKRVTFLQAPISAALLGR